MKVSPFLTYIPNWFFPPFKIELTIQEASKKVVNKV